MLLRQKQKGLKLRMSERKVPMRRCVGCMTSFPKSEIVRIVASEGKLVIDHTGKLNGRGAYLCRSLVCLDMAIKKKRLSYALGASLTSVECEVFKEEYAKEISGAEVNE